jgi:diguanylate cyclase (GGDEF)-like protein/PAS domain S-box-containing protein
MMPDANPPVLPGSADPLGPWSVLIGAMMHAVWLVDAKRLRIVAANPAASELLGVPVADLLDKPVLELAATPEELCFWGEVADGLSNHIESETLVRRFDGGVVPVTRRVSRAATADGADLYVVALHDRSEQVRTERALDVAAAELAATLESTADGILVTDLAGRIRNCNQRFATMWDVPADLLTQRNDDALLEWMRRSVVDPAAYMRRLAALDEATLLQSSDVLHLHSGRVIERVSLPQCSRGRPIGRVFSFRDITEKIEAGAQIESLSYSDALTGLPNRRRLSDRIRLTLAQAQREATSFALLLINLDRFKHVNDTLGHAFGDRVLCEVANRLKSCFRQEDTLARLGGDEFVLLLQGADAASAEASAQRILDSLRQPFNQAGMRFTVTASIGIAIYPPDGLDMDELMSRADAAMHEVKKSGRAGFRFHQSRMQQREAGARSRMQLDHAMRQALTIGAFRLHYQPQVDLETGEVHGVEALIRWTDPELGEVPPSEFIPVAEDSGFIVAIGDWVLHEAVRQASSWQAEKLDMAVSVNVSTLQFQQPGFVDGVAAALRSACLPAHLLELELTESMLLHDAQEALLRLQSLAQLGVKLAIDDFGTGYSSLNYLKRLPVHRLKIDRSFVSGLPDDESDVGIVSAIIHMGRALHLQIVAEGVETEAQRLFLKKAGCNLFQGFLFARALEPAALVQRLAATAAPRKRVHIVKH